MSQYYGAANKDLADPFEAAAKHGAATVRALLNDALWDDADYKAFLRDNEASAGLASGNADLSEMAAGLRAMPKFQEAMGRWSLHISLVSELVSRYEAFGLEAGA